MYITSLFKDCMKCNNYQQSFISRRHRQVTSVVFTRDDSISTSTYNIRRQQPLGASENIVFQQKSTLFLVAVQETDIYWNRYLPYIHKSICTESRTVEDTIQVSTVGLSGKRQQRKDQHHHATVHSNAHQKAVELK